MDSKPDVMANKRKESKSFFVRSKIGGSTTTCEPDSRIDTCATEFANCSSTNASTEGSVLQSQNLPNSGSKRQKTSSKKDLKKRALIEEMKLKAHSMKRQLEEVEKRSTYLKKIQDLENELAYLSNEEAKRMVTIGNEGHFLPKPPIYSSKAPHLVISNASTNEECELDQVKRFCNRIRTGELKRSACNEGSRIRGGAGCRTCAIGTAPVFDFENNNFQQYPHTLDNILPYNVNNPMQPSSHIDDLKQIANELLAEITKVRKQNALNRKKIIDLCVELKQKEAAIMECSELLCVIMNEGSDIGKIIEEVQSGQLEKHIEYLRWMLIRLQFENAAQKDEINSLSTENKLKQQTLDECLDAKNRICAEKKQQEDALLTMTSLGPCEIPLAHEVDTRELRNP